MRRVLLIEADRTFAEAIAIACLEEHVATRLAETLCEGVRYLLEFPVSIILIDAALMRLSAAEQLRLFHLVAPGVPVAVVVAPGTSTEGIVDLEMQGFRVIIRPFELGSVLANLELPSRSETAFSDAVTAAHAVCA